MPRRLPDDAGADFRRAAKLPDKPIKALFITVDPERDTAKLMADYCQQFRSAHRRPVRARRDEIAAVEKAYRVYARKAPDKDGDYTMDHSSVVYLMDANGAFVEAFNLDRSAGRIGQGAGRISVTPQGVARMAATKFSTTPKSRPR